MSDPMQNLNDAAAALNQVAARAGGFWDQADAEIAERQAAYDGMAGNLRGVVNDQMYFVANVDPDEQNPTNVDGGTFNSISTAVSRAPAGAWVQLQLLAGKTYPITQWVHPIRHFINIKKTGAGANPKLKPTVFSDENYNHMVGFIPRGGTTVNLSEIDVELPTAKEKPALPWSSATTLVGYDGASTTCFNASYANITGAEGLGLLSNNIGHANMTLYACTLNGNISGVPSIGGVCRIAHHAVTLQNGATLHSGGTLGSNLLKN